jgi:hypothetical protein
MSAKPTPKDAALESLEHAPAGPPLTDADRARLAQIRLDPRPTVPQSQVLAELEERRKRGG